MHFAIRPRAVAHDLTLRIEGSGYMFIFLPVVRSAQIAQILETAGLRVSKHFIPETSAPCKDRNLA